MRIYVGNLPFSVNDAELGSMFGEFGEIQTSQVIIDRDTGRSRGFGFVEMSDDSGRSAIEKMNGQECGGRDLVVNEARERQPRTGGGGGGGGYGGGGGGGGGRGGSRGGGGGGGGGRW